MNKTLLKSSALIVVSLGLVGCGTLFGEEGYFRDRGDDYLKAEPLAPISIPEGVEKNTVAQIYGIPTAKEDNYQYPEEFEAPRPQPLSANVLTEKVKIQKLGDSRWILLNISPSEVWPRVRSFLTRSGLRVVQTDPSNGLIETDWVQFKNDPEHKDRYRLQIDQGVQPGTAEIHALHMSVAAETAGKGPLSWPNSSADLEREAWIVDELAAELASETTAGATSLLAQTIGGGTKINIKTDGSEPVLHIGLEFSRAWATVGHAVAQEGFSVFDADSTMGIYYVNYQKPATEEEEEGFFSGLFSGDKNDGQLPTSPYTLQQVLSHLQLSNDADDREIFSQIRSSNSGEVLADAPGYLVVVRGQDDDIQIRIRDAYAKKLHERDAKDLLAVIRRNLI